MAKTILSPEITERSGPSLVWIIPLLTALVGGWLIVKTLSEQGPVATISFHTADGIEAGKTRIKYKNVDIGVVDAIRFSEDFSHVILTAKFNQGTESFLRRNTRFWVVRPQLGIRGASGLSTLVSGAYIEIEPGQGAPQYHFVGLETQPVVQAGTVGKRIVLVTRKLGSIDTGSPVYYKGVLAGEVLGHELANDLQSVYVHAFIKTPFDQLISGNSRFWNVSGMEISMNADGFNVRTESLQSLLFGGISFETPESPDEVSDDVENLVYTLYESHSEIQERSYSRKITYVAYFENSVRGLNVGAPVEFQGIRVGTVRNFALEYNNEEKTFRIPIYIEIEPERFMGPGMQSVSSPAEILDSLIDNGLAARLQTGNLLTGQLYVELGMIPDSSTRLAGSATDNRIREIPTRPGAGLEAISRSAEAFVAKLDSLNIEGIGRELLGTLEGTNILFNSPAVQGSISELEASMTAFRGILEKIDRADPDQTINAGRDVLMKLEHTLRLTDKLLQPESPLQYNLIQMTGELEEAARSIRSLVEMLEQNPRSLIFGRGKEGD